MSEYLIANNILGISEIDTRKLTRILREKGAQNGCIITIDDASDESLQVAQAKALTQAKDFPGLKGMDLAKVVSTKEQYQWVSGSWSLGHAMGEGYTDFSNSLDKLNFHVVAFS